MMIDETIKQIAFRNLSVSAMTRLLILPGDKGVVRMGFLQSVYTNVCGSSSEKGSSNFPLANISVESLFSKETSAQNYIRTSTT